MQSAIPWFHYYYNVQVCPRHPTPSSYDRLCIAEPLTLYRMERELADALTNSKLLCEPTFDCLKHVDHQLHPERVGHQRLITVSNVFHNTGFVGDPVFQRTQIMDKILEWATARYHREIIQCFDTLATMAIWMDNTEPELCAQVKSIHVR